MASKYHQVRAAALIGVLMLVLAACGQSSPTRAPSAAPAAVPTQADQGAAPAEDTAPPTAAPATSGEATTVRLAYFPNLTHAVALVGVERGIFQEALGPNVTLDLKTFNAGPALIEAMFARA